MIICPIFEAIGTTGVAVAGTGVLVAVAGTSVAVPDGDGVRVAAGAPESPHAAATAPASAAPESARKRRRVMLRGASVMRSV
jgi:hypothetical protein